MISLRAEIAEAMREAARYAPHVTTGYEFRRMQSQPERHFAGRWFVGPHAVRRFLKRVPAARGWSYERALAAIISDTDAAHFVKALDTSAQLWRGPKPWRLRYIVTSAGSAGALPVLVTVQAACDRGNGRRPC